MVSIKHQVNIHRGIVTKENKETYKTISGKNKRPKEKRTICVIFKRLIVCSHWVWRVLFIFKYRNNNVGENFEAISVELRVFNFVFNSLIFVCDNLIKNLAVVSELKNGEFNFGL